MKNTKPLLFFFLHSRWMCVLAISFFCLRSAEGQVSVDRMIILMPATSPPAANVDVFNNDELRTIRVDTESFKMIEPSIDRDEGTTEGSLIVSPRSFTLPPKGRRAVRLLLRERPKEAEGVYRVNFVPSAAEDTPGGSGPKPGVNLQVLTGVGTLIFALPVNPKATVSWTASGDTLEVQNTGAVNFFVEKAESCSSTGEVCAVLDVVKRIYAGNRFTLPWKEGSFIKLSTSLENDKAVTVEIKTAEGSFSWDY